MVILFVIPFVSFVSLYLSNQRENRTDGLLCFDLMNKIEMDNSYMQGNILKYMATKLLINYQ